MSIHPWIDSILGLISRSRWTICCAFRHGLQAPRLVAAMSVG
jgi:hypothetical protein